MRSAGISTAVIAAIVIIVVGVGGAAVYFATQMGPTGPTTTSSASSTTSTSSTGSFTTVNGNVSAVVSQVNLMIQAFNNENVEALSNFYTSSSVEVWSGLTQGLGGTYTGAGNIRILYSSSIGHATTISVKASQLKMVTVAPDTVNDTMQLVESGTSNVLGKFNATVGVSQQWVNQGGTWSIQKENWNYLSFYVQNPSSATVFPQWGLQLSGHSPNLASEHVFEWNVAPYMAVAIYALIAAAVIAAVLVRPRQQKR